MKRSAKDAPSTSTVVELGSREARLEASRWLRYALDDARSAQTLLGAEGAPPRHAAFHAQQAAEKALKAILVAEGRSFPLTHNLVALLDMIRPAWRVREVNADWATLTLHAVEARYPDDLPDVSPAEAEAAVADAAQVVDAVADQLDPLLRER